MNGTQMKKKIYEKIQEKTKDADGYFERVNYFHTKQIYRPKLHFSSVTPYI